jgi:hypothetical protein
MTATFFIDKTGDSRTFRYESLWEVLVTRLSSNLLFVVIVGVLACVTSAHAELTPYLSYTIPGITNAIQQIDLADVDGDGSAEVLAFDGERFVLYSPAADSTLFIVGLDSILSSLSPRGCEEEYVDVRILLADVNRDSLIDAALLVGLPCLFQLPTSAPTYMTRYVMAFLDNAASGSQPALTLDLEFESTHGIGMLDAVDLDCDGYDNLVLSVDSSELVDYSPYYFWVSDYSYGKTVVYQSFPDSVSLATQNQFLSVQPLRTAAPRAFLASDRYASWDDPPTLGPNDVSGSVLCVLDSTVATLSVTSGPNDSFCWGTHDYMYRQFLQGVLTGDLDGNPSDVEVLATYDWSYGCDSYLMYHEADSSGHQLIMFRLIEPDSLAPLWSIGIGTDNYRGFLAHPSYSGQFLAIVNNALTRFDAADGSVVRQYDPLPAGSKTWVYPYGDRVPYLMNVNGQTVSYYTFDEVTDVETGTPDVLPATFTLGRPYPNPFNPTVTIPLTVNRKGHLRVDVFNPLGQRVATLHDAIASPGETVLSWDASDFGSGVYLIKATLGAETQTVKAVLVK